MASNRRVEDRVLRGVQRQNLEEWVMNVIQSKIHSMFLPYYETVRLDDQKVVAVISFPQGISKPYVVRDRGKEEIYIRVGSTSRLAIREQLEAVRETLINALAHRDWTRFVEIEVGGYADRLEVISPGTLPNGMSIEKMKAGQRSPRNLLIMEVLRDYGYVDYRGMGVRTKIVPLTRAHTGKEPVFSLTDDYLKTTLYRKLPGG